jgi:heme exporter protein B
MKLTSYFIFCMRLHMRQRREVILPLLFLVMVLSLFPLALPTKQLAFLAPMAVWVTVLLAILLSAQNLFKEDMEDGFLIQLFLSPISLSLLMGIKLLAHWLTYIAPFFLVLPLVAIWYNLDWHMVSVLALSLLAGTPCILILSAIASALAVGLKQGGILLMLITLPLAIPLLLFSLSMVDMTASGLSYTAPFYFLLAMAVLSVSLGPWVIAVSLRLSMS